jgi:uncharacterized membrane protein
MTTERMETFSDGVIAIIITIMALELKMPEGEGIASLWGVLPTFLAYLLSFVYLGIYWVNHHHMLRVTQHVNGKILWANLHLLFWLSIVPAATSWLGDHPRATVPTAVYAATMLMPAIAYYILQNAIISLEGPRSTLAAAVGRDMKGKISPLLYAAAIGLAWVKPWMSDVIFVLVALIWLVPDPRIEAQVRHHDDTAGMAARE